MVVSYVLVVWYGSVWVVVIVCVVFGVVVGLFNGLLIMWLCVFD